MESNQRSPAAASPGAARGLDAERRLRSLVRRLSLQHGHIYSACLTDPTKSNALVTYCTENKGPLNTPLSDLDRIDLKILRCLQEDGRISILKLAEVVALSPTAVLARVMCLTNEGYGLGYEARNYTVMKEVKSTTRLALG